MTLEGKRVVVLGGSSGIGFATAQAAAKQGAAVVIASSRQARIDEALATLPSGSEGRVVDLANEAAVRRLFADLGLFDHLVFTAGETLQLGLLADIDEWLEKLAPFRADYRHHRTGETNGDSHLKSLLVHHEVIVPVTKGKLDFGPWQQVYYAEFDGQRPKRVIIKAMGE